MESLSVDGKEFTIAGNPATVRRAVDVYGAVRLDPSDMGTQTVVYRGADVFPPSDGERMMAAVRALVIGR